MLFIVKKYTMKSIFYLLLILTFFSCISKEKELTEKVKKLERNIDSLKKAPSFRLEELLKRDEDLSLIRKRKDTVYLPKDEFAKYQILDSLLVEDYLKFYSELSNSSLGVFALNRIEKIDRGRKITSYNDLVGEWELVNIEAFVVGNYVPKERVIITKDFFIKTYKNGILVKENKIQIKKANFCFKRYLSVKDGEDLDYSIRKNKLLVLSKSVYCSIISDRLYKVYRKVD